MLSKYPTMPYWPAYPEPERSRIEAAYRVEVEKYQREFFWVGIANGVLVVAAVVAVSVGAIMLPPLLMAGW